MHTEETFVAEAKWMGEWQPGGDVRFGNDLRVTAVSASLRARADMGRPNQQTHCLRSVAEGGGSKAQGTD
jgi:hypothetical protein